MVKTISRLLRDQLGHRWFDPVENGEKNRIGRPFFTRSAKTLIFDFNIRGRPWSEGQVTNIKILMRGKLVAVQQIFTDI